MASASASASASATSVFASASALLLVLASTSLSSSRGVSSFGGDGSDTLTGGAGDDIIYGDALDSEVGNAGAQTGLALSQSLELMGMPASEFGDITILSDKELRGFAAGDALAGPTTAMVPDDDGYGTQWYLSNPNAALGGVDIDIETVWDEYSGLGVTLGIIDDGIDYTHADIVGNYDTSIDYDALDGILGLGSDDPISDGLDDFHGRLVHPPSSV